MDAARVLRLVGTGRSSAGVVMEALTPLGQVWDFDDLANEILPFTRGQIVELRIERAARTAKKPSAKRQKAPVPWWWMNVEKLWEARLTDLQTLRWIRWFGDRPPGQRDYWMFLAGNAMSWLVPPERLARELYALARKVAGWHDRESKLRMHAIFKRSHMAARGEKVVWEGVEIDPRYRFKTETIIEGLEITNEEQKQMLNLISPLGKYHRKRAKEDEKRCKARGATQASISYPPQPHTGAQWRAGWPQRTSPSTVNLAGDRIGPRGVRIREGPRSAGRVADR